jgi:hypothetical protein
LVNLVGLLDIARCPDNGVAARPAAGRLAMREMPQVSTVAARQVVPS